MADTGRRLVVWMYSDQYPTWSMPDSTLDAIQSALGPGWEVDPIRVPTFAGGDGSRKIPPAVIDAIADAEIYFGWGIPRELFIAADRSSS